MQTMDVHLLLDRMIHFPFYSEVNVMCREWVLMKFISICFVFVTCLAFGNGEWSTWPGKVNCIGADCTIVFSHNALDPTSVQEEGKKNGKKWLPLCGSCHLYSSNSQLQYWFRALWENSEKWNKNDIKEKQQQQFLFMSTKPNQSFAAQP